MREKEIRRAIIFENQTSSYFIITSKEILNNIKGNYNLFLESKLKDVKNTFNSLNEAVIELFDNDEEQIIYWFNEKAKNLFPIKVDENITNLISKARWDLIYKKIKTNSFKEHEIIEIGDNIFQLTVIYSEIMENSIIKLLFTNISEIANKNKEIEESFKFLYEEVPYAIGGNAYYTYLLLLYRDFGPLLSLLTVLSLAYSVIKREIWDFIFLPFIAGLYFILSNTEFLVQNRYMITMFPILFLKSPHINLNISHLHKHVF